MWENCPDYDPEVEKKLKQQLKPETVPNHKAILNALKQRERRIEAKDVVKLCSQNS